MKGLSELFTRDVDLVILGAVIGVVLTFAGTYVYDRLKAHRERVEARRLTLRVLTAECEVNVSLLARNIEILKEDVEAQKNRRQVLVPLVPLPTSAWEIATRSSALSDGDWAGLKDVADAYEQIRVLNQHVLHRELFQLNNQAMSHVAEEMAKHDALILSDADRLSQRLVAAQTVLQTVKRGA